MNEIFFDLSVILGLGVAFSFLAKLLKQPQIIAYILTGMVAGQTIANFFAVKETLTAFSHIGIALLLFIVGLGLKPKVIKEVGKVAVISGLGQILFTVAGGFIISKLLGFNDLTSFYISVAFAFSSTIIIGGLLYHKNEHETLYGRISIGFLLVQDFVAMLFLLIVASFGANEEAAFVSALFWLALKIIIAGLAVFCLVRFIIPRVDRIFARDHEILFIFSLGLCFIFATVFYKLNFSLELGALLAGVALATSPYQREIFVKLSPVRDFFMILFFVVLGAGVTWADVAQSWEMIVVFSLFILIGNPFIMLVIMRWLGYTLKTSFLVGLTVAQISEFSLIVLGVGAKLGHLPASFIGPSTVIGLITILISSYYIYYNHQLYHFLEKVLHFIFGKDKHVVSAPVRETDYQVILFGCHRLGGGLVQSLAKMKASFLVVDHDPEVVKNLGEQAVAALYGSADDSHFLDLLPLAKAQLLVSTIPEFEANRYMLRYLKNKKIRAGFICLANHLREARQLYDNGADYVIMPPYLGRRLMSELLEKNKFDLNKYSVEKKRQLKDFSWKTRSAILGRD